MSRKKKKGSPAHTIIRERQHEMIGVVFLLALACLACRAGRIQPAGHVSILSTKRDAASVEILAQDAKGSTCLYYGATRFYSQLPDLGGAIDEALRRIGLRVSGARPPGEDASLLPISYASTPLPRAMGAVLRTT